MFAVRRLACVPALAFLLLLASCRSVDSPSTPLDSPAESPELGVEMPAPENVPIEEVNAEAARQAATDDKAGQEWVQGWQLYYPYTFFRQCDPSWAGVRLGWSNYTLCNSGCVVTCMAMAYHRWGHALNPAQVNAWGKSAGAFSGPSVIWNSIGDYGTNRTAKWLTYSQIYEYVRRGWPVLMETDLYGGHWVLVHAFSRDGDGRFWCKDPLQSASTQEQPVRGTFRRACVFVW